MNLPKIWSLPLLFIGLATSSSSLKAASPWVQQAQLSIGTTSDQFGSSVATQGDLAIIGALMGDGNVADSGSAFIYGRAGTTWSQVAKLSANDSSQFAKFGFSVGLDGTRAIVGAKDNSPRNIQFAGSAYVFDQSNAAWSQSAKLSASDAAASDSFGASVAVFGNRALVGASNDDYSSRTDAGSAYVFDRDAGGTWSQSQKLTPNDPQSSANFGQSSVLSQDRAVVGAPFFSTSSRARAGAVYVFDYQNGVWGQTAELMVPDASDETRLGSSIAISGTRILVGAPGETVAGGTFAGAAYIFDLQNGIWTETAKLVEPNPHAGDDFGFSVSLDGDRAVIGSPGATVSSGSLGAAFVFDLMNGLWQNTAVLQANNATSNDAFGEAVGVSGDSALIGARLADTSGGTNAGSVYVYAVPEPATLTLLALGAIGLLVARRLRRGTLVIARTARHFGRHPS